MKVRTEARRDLIVTTASQVFLELGYERASMAEITKRVGGSKATLYGYFPSKEALFVEVILTEAKRHMEAAVADLMSQSEGSLRTALIQFGGALVGFLCSNVARSSFRMVIAETGRSEIGPLFYEEGPKQGLKQLADVLKAAMKRGELRQADPWIAAQHLDGLLTSETRSLLFYRDAEPVTTKRATKIAERAVDVFLRGYGV